VAIAGLNDPNCPSFHCSARELRSMDGDARGRGVRIRLWLGWAQGGLLVPKPHEGMRLKASIV
jgi:hypothetical protein